MIYRTVIEHEHVFHHFVISARNEGSACDATIFKFKAKFPKAKNVKPRVIKA
jgi:hypothetical protein